MNPFANDDEPAPPASYHPDLPQWLRMGLWYGRNPAHNLTHYMIGLSSKSFTVTRSRPDSDNDGFADGGGFLRCTLRCEDGTSRPYISHQSARVEAYAGWRPAPLPTIQSPLKCRIRPVTDLSFGSEPSINRT